MKLFLDTANVQAISVWKDSGIIDGVTTNPSLLSKEGKNPLESIAALCAMFPAGDISVEVTEQEPDKVYEQALKISRIAPQVVVKIPCHVQYYPIIHKLVQEGIKLNITLVFSLVQSLMMCKLNVRYISPFVGRLDDIGESGIQLIKDIRCMVDQYAYTTQILAASLRSLSHVHDVILAGADVATIPIDIIQKMVAHPLTDTGMAKFLSDWKSLKISQFP